MRWIRSSKFIIIIRNPIIKITIGNIKERKFSVLYLKNKKLMSIDCINKPKDFMAGKKLIHKKNAIDPLDLSGPEINLNDLLEK